MIRTVAIAGLGAVGLPLARALDQGVEGLKLVSVASRDSAKALAAVSNFRTPPQVISLPELAEADIVVEAIPASIFERVAVPAVEAGRIFVPTSVGAMLPRMHLVRLAVRTGARIVIPTGALLGLDAVRAAAEGPIESVSLETRKPPAGLERLSSFWSAPIPDYAPPFLKSGMLGYVLSAMFGTGLVIGVCLLVGWVSRLGRRRSARQAGRTPDI